MERNCKFFRLAYHKSKLMQSDKKLHFLTHKINFEKMGKIFHFFLLFGEDAFVTCSPDPTTSSKTKHLNFHECFWQIRTSFARLDCLFILFSLFKKRFDWFKIHQEIQENLGIAILKLIVGSFEQDVKFISTFDFDFPRNEIQNKKI